MFVSPVLMIIPSSTNRQVDHFHPTRYMLHLRAGIFYRMLLKKNNNAAKFFVFEAKLFGRLHWHTINFVSFKKRPNSSLYVQYSRTLIRFFKDFKFAYKTTKFYTKINDLSTTSDKNTNFNISKNLLCKVGISSSLCSRTV